MVTFTLDTLQLNGTSSLLDPLLDKIIKACPYNSCKNSATLILLAQTAVKMDENYYVKTKNTIPIDATWIWELQSINIMNKDSLLDCSNTSFAQAAMQVIWKNSRFYLNFD